VPIVHDVLLDRFINDVSAIRLRKPNHDGCGSECLFYEVSATLRGRFFSGAKGGFGLEECCHLLVIEKVVNLSSKRTSVPAGGEFECTSDRWQPTPEELKALSAIPACSLRADFNNCYAVLAKHWGETIKPGGGLKSSGPWMSRDMTLSYRFIGGFISGRDQRTQMTTSSSVIREACRPRSAPVPSTDHIYCDFHRSYGLGGQNAAKTSQRTARLSDEPSRSSPDMVQAAWSAFQDLGRTWKIADSLSVERTECVPWPAAGSGNEQQFGYCDWYSRDDLQQVYVLLQRSRNAKKADGGLDIGPWTATEVTANACRAGKELR
jgi:hypothetical protein